MLSSITKRLSGCVVGALHSFLETPTSYLELYASLTVPDHSRLTGGSFSRLVILPTSMRKRLRAQEEEEKKHRARARGGDRNHIALRHRRRISNSRIAAASNRALTTS